MNNPETYSIMREIADSWGLLAMAVMWLSFAIWALRPGARRHHEDAANMIFKDENDG